MVCCTQSTISRVFCGLHQSLAFSGSLPRRISSEDERRPWLCVVIHLSLPQMFVYCTWHLLQLCCDLSLFSPSMNNTLSGTRKLLNRAGYPSVYFPAYRKVAGNNSIVNNVSVANAKRRNFSCCANYHRHHVLFKIYKKKAQILYEVLLL